MQRQCPRGVFGGVVLLMALHGALALPPAKGEDWDNAPFASCPVQQLTRGHSVTYVTLEDNLNFAIRPSQSMMHLRILLDHTLLYKATVQGTMVKLFKCEGETRCVTLNEGGTKSSDLLFPGQWNKVYVSLADNKITVDVNTKANVIGMVVAANPVASPTIQVSLVASDPSAPPPKADHYSAMVNIQCNDTYTPELVSGPPLPSPPVTTSGPAAPATTTMVQVHPAPFVQCPLYEVRVDHPLPYVTVEGSLRLAVHPRQSSLYLRVLLDRKLYKASIEGTMVKLLRCDGENQSCVTVDEGGSKSSDLLTPNQWNLIVISLSNHTITVDINMKANVMVITRQDGRESAQVSVVAPNSTLYPTLAVNIQCNGTYTPEIHPRPTTPSPLATPEPVVDTSTTSPTLPHKHVGIIVGVLVALLVLITVAVTISCYKKRNSANINQHTPLCEQQQHK